MCVLVVEATNVRLILLSTPLTTSQASCRGNARWDTIRHWCRKRSNRVGWRKESEEYVNVATASNPAGVIWRGWAGHAARWESCRMFFRRCTAVIVFSSKPRTAHPEELELMRQNTHTLRNSIRAIYDYLVLPVPSKAL
jgi:hypothetical protein